MLRRAITDIRLKVSLNSPVALRPAYFLNTWKTAVVVGRATGLVHIWGFVAHQMDIQRPPPGLKCPLAEISPLAVLLFVGGAVLQLFEGSLVPV